MKKYLQSGWMRILSSVLCAISIVSLLIGVLGFIFVTAFRDGEDVYESGYKEVAENYALYAIDKLEYGEEEQLKKEFTEKNINCSIQLVINKANENGEIISNIEKEVTIGEINEDEKVELEVIAGSELRYRPSEQGTQRHRRQTRPHRPKQQRRQCPCLSRHQLRRGQ